MKIMKQGSTIQYVVRETKAEAPDVVTLRLARADGAPSHFLPGQFISVYFPDGNTPEGKAYSISSAPHESRASAAPDAGSFLITVKGIGFFSNRLCAMVPGDVVDGSEPYGYFRSETEPPTSPLVMVAAGIGVTPFRGIVMHELHEHPGRPLELLYSARAVGELVFRAEFDRLVAEHPEFRARYFVTRESDPVPGVTHRRIQPTDIVGRPAGAEYLLCGSISFVRDMWKGLRALGVPEEAIYTEAFFSN